MPPFERRKVEELLSLYTLEPTLRDVYVEGAADFRLVKWFLDESGASTVSVNEIDDVEVPPQTVEAMGLPNNNRGRLITLANHLERALGASDPRASFIIDRDFDPFTGTVQTCTLVFPTDYSCLEMYCFNVACINKILTVYVGHFPEDAAAVLAAVSGTLQELFLIRLASHLLGWNLGNLQVAKYLELANGGVAFDEAEYVRRLLLRAGRRAQLAELIERIDEERQNLRVDSRMQINGHDFVEVLAWYIRSHRRRNLSSEALGEILFLCVELEDLSNEGLFKALLERVLG